MSSVSGVILRKKVAVVSGRIFIPREYLEEMGLLSAKTVYLSLLKDGSLRIEQVSGGGADV